MPKFILQDFHCCLKYFNHASQHATPRSKQVSATGCFFPPGQSQAPCQTKAHVSSNRLKYYTTRMKGQTKLSNNH